MILLGAFITQKVTVLCNLKITQDSGEKRKKEIKKYEDGPALAPLSTPS